MPAILRSSAAPIAAGTRFQTSRPSTAIIASAIQAGASRPNAVGSACSGAPAAWMVALVVTCSAMAHCRLDGRGRFAGADRDARQPFHHLLRGLGGDILDVGQGR